MKAVDDLGRRVTTGEVTSGEVTSRAGLKLTRAETALEALAADSRGVLEVSDEGDVLYLLPQASPRGYFLLNLEIVIPRVLGPGLMDICKGGVVLEELAPCLDVPPYSEETKTNHMYCSPAMFDGHPEVDEQQASENRLLQRRNADVEERNCARLGWVAALERADTELRQKLKNARGSAKQTMLGRDRVIYSKEKEVSAQNCEAQDWEQPLQ